MKQTYEDTTDLFGPHWKHFMPLIGEKGDLTGSYGTAILIAPHIAITAAHILEDYLKWHNLKPEDLTNESEIEMSLYLLSIPEQKQVEKYQTFKDIKSRTIYNVKQIIHAIPSDIAVLILQSDKWPDQYPSLDLRPPAIGDDVFAFGYPGSDTEISDELEGDQRTLMLGISPKIAEGPVLDCFPVQRGEYTHSFPMFEAHFRTDGGMSGGPIISKKTGDIVGIVSASPDTTNEFGDYITIAASLAPLLRVKIAVNGHEFSLFDYLEKRDLPIKNREDYQLDKNSNTLSYHGPERDLTRHL
jgi:hypothetical protein